MRGIATVDFAESSKEMRITSPFVGLISGVAILTCVVWTGYGGMCGMWPVAGRRHQHGCIFLQL